MLFRKSSSKSLIDQAAELVERAAPHLETARDKIVDEYLPVAQQAFADAKETGVPAAQEKLAVAREQARTTAQETVLPAASAAMASAREKLPEQLGGTPPKRSRGKKLLTMLGVLGIGALVAKMMAGRKQGESIPPYVPPTPTPVPHPAAATADSTPESDLTQEGAPVTPDPAFDPARPSALDEPAGEESADEAGADPAEALADQQDGPHRTTTPDDPAEVVDLSDVEDPKA